jgi:hypothetical protein
MLKNFVSGSGKWWRFAKFISNFTKARDPPPFLEHDGQIFIHPSDKAEILNTHFSNIANIDSEPVISDNVAPLPCHLKVSLFLYSSFAFLTKTITSFLISLNFFQ